MNTPLDVPPGASDDEVKRAAWAMVVSVATTGAPRARLAPGDLGTVYDTAGAMRELARRVRKSGTHVTYVSAGTPKALSRASLPRVDGALCVRLPPDPALGYVPPDTLCVLRLPRDLPPPVRCAPTLLELGLTARWDAFRDPRIPMAAERGALAGPKKAVKKRSGEDVAADGEEDEDDNDMGEDNAEVAREEAATRDFEAALRSGKVDDGVGGDDVDEHAEEDEREVREIATEAYEEDGFVVVDEEEEEERPRHRRRKDKGKDKDTARAAEEAPPALVVDSDPDDFTFHR